MEERRRNRRHDRDGMVDATPAEVEAITTDALRQTGMVVTEANRDSFCQEDLRAWAEAIARYEALHS